MSRSRNPPQRGQGAARAKQLGLLLDVHPDGGMEGGNDEDLEAELLALVGGGGGGRSPAKKAGGKAPLPMEDIERMAAMCMKDLDDDDDEDLEGDEDLLAELNDVLEDDEDEAIELMEEEEEEERPKPPRPAPRPTPPATSPRSPPATSPSSGGGGTAGGVEGRLQERIQMYQMAIANAKAAGESSKARRYERGLKTLQSMLTAAKKGKPINEEEMPPPVATGAKPAPAPSPGSPPQPEPVGGPEEEEPAPAYTPPAAPVTNRKPQPEVPPKPQLQVPQQRSPDTPAISPLTPGQTAHDSELKAQVLGRQREYKLAAIHAKQSGNSDLAKRHYMIAKSLDSVVEAVDRGEPVDVSSLPPPPVEEAVSQGTAAPAQVNSKPAPAPAPTPAPTPAQPPAAIPAPRSLAEALQQRMQKYQEASDAAKSKGDDRKARMHQRIVKQYQDAIRANKAGKQVNLADLPVPPGCPPLQGTETGEQNFVGVLETAMKLANQDADADDGDDDDVAKPAVRPAVQKARAPAPPSGGSPGGTPALKLGGKAQQQLEFLLTRRQQFVKAALRSKQMKDMQGAAQHLKHAKGLDAMIQAAKSGLPVDISKIPSAPVSEEDYSLGRSRSSPLSPRSSEQYSQLMGLLKQQHEKCLKYSQQFTHLGNVSETARFEKLAEECMSNIELLKKAHAKGQPVPSYHMEERTINTVKMYPDITANEMLLIIVKGINLPAPSGVASNDLDASVRFELPFPSSEEPQKDKTSTIKNTNCPEFKEQFKLSINRTHRAFKRVVQSKGIKFEIFHKGGLFKGDKSVGTAQLKLDALENQCDLRQIIDVVDGRKPTGGRLEVRVKIREPLGGSQLQSVTEKWIVLDPLQLSPPERDRERAPSPRSKPRSDHERNDNHSNSKHSHSPPQYKMHSFSLLNYDKDRLEKKLEMYRKTRRDPPSDLIHQHKEVCRRLQWQKSYLERGSSSALSEYEHVLKKLAQGLSDSIKKFSSQGNRDAAKDALGRMKMVEQEMESLRKRRSL